MSLEAAIKELTTAVTVLNETLSKPGMHPGAVNKAPKAAPAKAPTIEEDVFDEPEAKAAAPAKPAVPKAAKPAAPAAPVATADAAKNDAYAPVKKAILDAVAAGHRKSINDMLAEYDAKSAKDLTPDVYPEVLEKVAAITGGEVEDLA